MTGALGVYPQVTGRLKENAAPCTDRPYQASDLAIGSSAALADSSTSTEAKTRALQKATHARNVELSIYRVNRAEEIAATIDKAQASVATALNVLASGMLDDNAPLIMERVAALRLPTIYQ